MAQPEPMALDFSLAVNGQAVKPGEVVEADFGEVAELLFRFPVAMDRTTVEAVWKRLPERTTMEWLDDRTCLMLVPPGDSFVLDPEGALSRDGTARAGTGRLEVRRQAYPRVTLYQADDLAAGRKEPVARWRLPYRPTGFALAPDRKTALLYPSDPMAGGPEPTLLDLESGGQTPIPVKAEHGWFSEGGWLPDGRLFLLSTSLWVSDPKGEGWQELASGLFSWVARLSPQGSHLALWSPLDKEHLTVVDLSTGEVRYVKGPFRRPAADAAIDISWSPDGRWLAGSDFDSEADGSGAKIRVVDPFGQQPGRVHPGSSLAGWLPSGELVGWRRGRDREEPDKGELSLIDGAGNERPLLDRWARPSPDGRYLAYTEYSGGTRVSYLVETATGHRIRTPLQDSGVWTDRGEWLVLEGP